MTGDKTALLKADEEKEKKILNKIDKTIPADEVLYDLADLFKMFGDSTRVKILFVLSKYELCVYHISELTGMSQSAISHQLRTLKQNKLVKSRRHGKQVFYSLADEHVQRILLQGLDHVLE